MLKSLFIVFCFVTLLLPAFAEEKEITNLREYFEYLPNEVHKNWIPYKAEKDYEVVVQFSVKKNGEITKPEIIKTSNEKANKSVVDAVLKSAPYKNLPDSYKMDSVKAQVELRYIK